MFSQNYRIIPYLLMVLERNAFDAFRLGIKVLEADLLIGCVCAVEGGGGGCSVFPLACTCGACFLCSSPLERAHCLTPRRCLDGIRQDYIPHRR